MREYLIEAFILDKTAVYETDLTVDFYTCELGRVKAKITSGQKIASKLSPHLEPLTFSLVRLTEKNGFVVADALVQNRLKNFRRSPKFFAEGVKLLAVLKTMIYPEAADQKLWFWLKQVLNRERIFYPQFLKILGYDSRGAVCHQCRSKFVRHFLIESQIFLCRQCGFKIPKNILSLDL